MNHVALMTSALLVAGYSGCALAEPSSQESFKSPEEASAALFTAVQHQDPPTMGRILGAGNELLSSGDAAQDKADRERFVEKYRQMHRLAREPHGDRLLYVGAENWPFPVPITEENGAWRFDADAGQREIRFRRIGEDEVTAIALCHTLQAAARSGNTSASDELTAEVLAAAKDAGTPTAFHGYYFRMLRTSPGGSSFVAYPAVYGVSGVMTFFMGPDGGVRQKDLGANTARAARAVTEADLDAAWIPAEPDLRHVDVPRGSPVR
jgi:Protein of unknown function (DUF2950)